MDKLYGCYDREIGNLWQRSVFLGVFLAGVFVAYGACWKMLFEYDGEHGWGFLLGVDLAMAAVCAAGAMVSLLWIFMAKGSKAYQEIYEMKIAAFVRHFGVLQRAAREEGACGRDAEWRIADEFLVRNGVEPSVLGAVNRRRFRDRFGWSSELSQSPFSLKGGAYSSGKVNVAVGVISLCLWIAAGAYHVMLQFFIRGCQCASCRSAYCDCACRECIPADICRAFFSMENGLFVPFLFVLALACIIIAGTFFNLKSGSILDREP